MTRVHRSEDLVQIRKFIIFQADSAADIGDMCGIMRDEKMIARSDEDPMTIQLKPLCQPRERDGFSFECKK
jgi:hypothetical protein